MLLDEFSQKEKQGLITLLLLTLISIVFYQKVRDAYRTAKNPEYAKAIIGEKEYRSKSNFLNYSFRDDNNKLYHGELGTTWRRVKLKKDSSYWAVYYKCDPRISTILEDIPPYFTEEQVKQNVSKKKIGWEIANDRQPGILQLRSCREDGK